MEALLFADTSKVKMEVDEDDILGGEVEMQSGLLAQMAEELEEDDLKKVEAENRMADLMELKEVKNRKKFLQNKKHSDSEEREGSVTRQDAEYLKKDKGEIKTFGLSSRPRRSVNYASIEKGEEATAQSLVTEFTSKKRAKRTRDEMDENYEDEVVKKKKNIPVSNLRHHSASKTPHKNVAPKYETELLKVIPSIDDERPTIEQRAIGIALEALPTIHKASGGFRRFLALMSDDLIMKLFKLVDENFNLETEDEEEKMLRIVRHAWNSQSSKNKKNWEKRAKMDAYESFKLIGGATLPLSEVPAESKAERAKRRAPDSSRKSDCCSMEPVFNNIQDVTSHYISAHDSVHFYGCHFCHSIFTSPITLRGHQCEQLGNYMLNLTMNGKIMETNCVYFFLSCSDCGLWLPLRTKVAGQKCWPYFSASMLAHPCRTFVPIMIYFAEEVADVAHVRLSFEMMPRLSCGIELDCKQCNIESFPKLSAAEEHFRTEHVENNRKCVRCDKVFGTDCAYRLHVATHFNPSLLFANFLKYSATYHPPQSSSRLLHYGSDKQNIVIGGFDSCWDDGSCAEKYTYDDFVEPMENVVKTKLRHVIEEGKTGRSRSGTPYSASSSSTCSSSSEEIVSEKDKPTRSDLGYEHVNFSMYFDDSEIQKEAKNKCKKVVDTRMSRMFLNGEKIVNPEKVMEMLGPNKETLTLEVAENFDADDYYKNFAQTLSLPISSCIDPLKDFLLFNKIYYYCPNCSSMFSGDISLHDKNCSDDIIELFHPATPASRGIHCTESGCDEFFCSVISLRCHVALRHGKFINYEVMSAGNEKRYDYSITAMSKYHEILKNDKRSRLARFTDIDIGMPIEGLLSRKEVPKLAITTASQVSGQVSGSMIKPMMLNQPGFDCVWCCYSTHHISHFQAHVIKFHVNICDRCGKSFATKQFLRVHTCDRRFVNDMGVPNHSLCGTCPFCQLRLTVTYLNGHLLKSHYDLVRFVEGTGQLHPLGENMKYEKADETRQHIAIRSNDVTLVTPSNPPTNNTMRATDRMKVIRYDVKSARNTDGILINGSQLVAQPADSVLYQPPSRSAADLRLTCYLCEMSFGSTQQLDEHLDKHPEKWKKCPFCQSPIRGHYEMQKHLLHTHMIRTVAAMVCEYCQIPSIRSPCAHLIYQCRRLPNCGICGIPVRSYEAHVSHMTAHHSNELKRIQCSFCAQIFITMTEFHDHICHMSANLQACACSSSKVFQSINDFCDHYDAVHVRPSLTCGICRNTFPSTTLFAKHRMTHMHSVPATLLRKVYLLPKWLHPTATRSSVSSWGRLSTTNMNKNVVGATTTPSILPVQSVAPRVVQTVERNSGTINDKLQAMFKNTTTTIDDDDDDDIVFECSVPSTKAASSSNPGSRGVTPPKTSENPAVNASVRIELNDQNETNAGQGQPGYVVEDDDDIEFVSEGQSTSQVETIPTVETAKVTAVEDPNGDDELAVVAEVENVSGVTSSTIASTSREKKFKCSKCSCAFMTNVSLSKHMETHKSDAGASTSTDTFGLPVICNAYICRSCCLAFESRRKYQQHVTIHGDTQLTCKLCSGIAFNSSIIAQHAKGHEQRQVYYACGTCKLRFYSDLHLCEHLHTQHNISLFYFCKLCGFGHTNLDKVFTHVQGNHNNSNYTITQRIGCCPAVLLNFEPIEPEDFKRDLLAGQVKCFTPSDCSHRSLLLSNDGLVSCTSCHCTQSLHSFVAYNKSMSESNSLAFAYSEPRSVAHQTFALSNFLSTANMHASLAKTSNGHPTIPLLPELNRIRMPVNRQQVPVQNIRVLNKNPNPEVRQINGVRVLRPVTSGVNAMTPVRNIVSVNRQPIAPRPIGNAMPASRLITNRTPGVGVTQRPLIRTGEAISFGSDGVPVLGGNSPKSIIAVEVERARRLMQTNFDKKWFCNQCGHSDVSEMKMMVHYYNDHLAEGLRKNPNLRAQVFDLQCPKSGCHIPPFQTLKLFEKHLHSHKQFVPWSSELCESVFGTKEKQVEHDRRHQEYEAQNGCDANCCPLCGTMDNWTMAKDPNMQIILSHVSRHGLDFSSSCRLCFAQFPDDVSYNQLISHFELSHFKECGLQKVTCDCGETELSLSQFKSHVVEKHAFNIVEKSSSSRYGELVVKAGNQLINHLGIEKYITVREAIARGTC